MKLADLKNLRTVMAKRHEGTEEKGMERLTCIIYLEKRIRRRAYDKLPYRHSELTAMPKRHKERVADQRMEIDLTQKMIYSGFLFSGASAC